MSKLDTFPTVMWDVLAAAIAGKEYVIDLPANNFAVSMRHRFHSFRKALIAEKFPNADALTNMMTTIREEDGRFKLVFVCLAEALQGAKDDVVVPGLPAAPAHQLVRDEAEEAVLRFMQQGSDDKPK